MTKERECPGFLNPQIVVSVVRADLVPDANLGVDHSFHLAKDMDPRVVNSVLRSALRAERRESPVPELESNEAGKEQSRFESKEPLTGSAPT
jgi:hypothetical protein